MVTPAQIRQRREAGRKSGRARGHCVEGSSEDANPDAPVPTSSDPEVDRMITGYVAMAGKPKYWSDIKALEQVRAEIYKTRAAARQDQIERGNLLTRDQVRARDEAHTAAIKEGLSSVTELLTAHVPPDRLLDAQEAAREWADRFLENLAAVLEGAK